ncbi:phosphatidylcholine transfer protein-like [Phacochoerus africanus]|uniref:phosphatidylcholine transfer protein-like n=1 Tax=Phacochoerus africanus TaxID=41426 RepID=UPI001FDA2017|nr:phosphatidylcholine transfer protein-like [Phacochoerus africanus]
MASAAGASRFSEKQFRSVCSELQQPAVDGADWELLVESMGFSIYRHLQSTGHYEYKVFGVLETCPPDIVKNVYLDLNYRKNWDEFVKELYARDCNGEIVIYWEVQCPSPGFNRDYVFVQQHRELEFKGQKVHVMLADSTSAPQFPEKSSAIRVKKFTQKLAVQSDGGRGSKVFMYYSDNLDCPVPDFIFKWAAQRGFPTYLKNMVNACHNYPRRS